MLAQYSPDDAELNGNIMANKEVIDTCLLFCNIFALMNHIRLSQFRLP